MNHTISLPTPTLPRAASLHYFPASSTPGSLDALQSRFALRVAARLTEHADTLNPDLAERLRFAREQALARARSVSTADAEPRLGATGAGAALLGRSGGRGSWWIRLATVLPVFALVGGLVLIQQWQDSTQISTAAEIDASLLADDLPPTAYSDAGFAEFLKTPGE